MSQDNSSGPRTLLILAGVALLIAVGSGYWKQHQANNQVVRPDPNAPPAPVVPQLPGLVAKLREAKSLCEGRARGAKDLVREGRLGAAKLAEGRRLYTETKAAFDACIDYLRSGLAARFNKDDPAHVEGRLREAQRKMGRFTEWADGLEPLVGAFNPAEEAGRLLRDWMKAVNEQNERAIERLRADLEACRLDEWGKLGE